MKKEIFAIILFLTIIGVGAYENIYFNNTMDELDKNCVAMEELINEKNIESTITVCENASNYWEEKNTFLEIVSYNPNVKNVSLDLQEILGALKANDDKSALARIYVLKQRIYELRETMSLSGISII